MSHGASHDFVALTFYYSGCFANGLFIRLTVGETLNKVGYLMMLDQGCYGGSINISVV